MMYASITESLPSVLCCIPGNATQSIMGPTICSLHATTVILCILHMEGIDIMAGTAMNLSIEVCCRRRSYLQLTLCTGQVSALEQQLAEKHGPQQPSIPTPPRTSAQPQQHQISSEPSGSGPSSADAQASQHQQLPAATDSHPAAKHKAALNLLSSLPSDPTPDAGAELPGRQASRLQDAQLQQEASGSAEAADAGHLRMEPVPMSATRVVRTAGTARLRSQIAIICSYA